MSIDPKSSDFDIKIGRDATGFYILSEKGDFAEKEIQRLKKMMESSPHLPRDLENEKMLREISEIYKVAKKMLDDYRGYLEACRIVEISAKHPVFGKPPGNVFAKVRGTTQFYLCPEIYPEIYQQNIIAAYDIVNEYERLHKL